MKKYITTFLIISMGISILILFKINKKNNEMLDKYIKELKNINSASKNIDSIMFENQVNDIQIMRYEYILERAQEEMSSDCKDKLDTIMSETE
jgi:MoaA/NifB/PqqE/SkfB family radical SAM enzyme